MVMVLVHMRLSVLLALVSFCVHFDSLDYYNYLLCIMCFPHFVLFFTIYLS